LVLMVADTSDTLMRTAAFEHVRRLSEIHDHLTAAELKPGFMFQGERIPLINPQRGEARKIIGPPSLRKTLRLAGPSAPQETALAAQRSRFGRQQDLRANLLITCDTKSRSGRKPGERHHVAWHHRDGKKHAIFACLMLASPCLIRENSHDSRVG
jgi:hypothetical protein